ncbi:hypothetical protein J6590_102751 [Homalodisca vitripennis]|nr:hypothetical protein J6590_102751 [Homalodisca vitripennis]
MDGKRVSWKVGLAILFLPLPKKQPTLGVLRFTLTSFDYYSTFYNARCINWQCPFTHEWSFGYVTVYLHGSCNANEQQDSKEPSGKVEQLKDLLQLPDTRDLDGNYFIKRPLSGANYTEWPRLCSLEEVLCV